MSLRTNIANNVKSINPNTFGTLRLRPIGPNGYGSITKCDEEIGLFACTELIHYMNKRIYKNAYKRYKKGILFGAFLEFDGKVSSYHLHIAYHRPHWISENDFLKLEREAWASTEWGLPDIITKTKITTPDRIVSYISKKGLESVTYGNFGDNRHESNRLTVPRPAPLRGAANDSEPADLQESLTSASSTKQRRLRPCQKAVDTGRRLTKEEVEAYIKGRSDGDKLINAVGAIPVENSLKSRERSLERWCTLTIGSTVKRQISSEGPSAAARHLKEGRGNV